MLNNITASDITNVKIHFPKTLKILNKETLVGYAELLFCNAICLSSIAVYKNTETEKYRIVFPGKDIEKIAHNQTDGSDVKKRIKHFCYYYAIKENIRLLIADAVMNEYNKAKIQDTNNTTK